MREVLREIEVRPSSTVSVRLPRIVLVYSVVPAKSKRVVVMV